MTRFSNSNVKKLFSTLLWQMLLFCVIFLTGCLTPFEPEVSNNPNGWLVVDGYINVSSEQVTKIKLSRTVSLSENALFHPESGASVFIEDDDQVRYALTEHGDGLYVSDTLTLDQTKKYRIFIQDNKEVTYTSEFAAPIVTPPIENISWTQTSEGVGIFVTTRKLPNKSTYYQWEFDETWKIHSFIQPQLIKVGSTIKFISGADAERIYTCWKFGTSRDLIFGSSAIHKELIAFIPNRDERLSVRYSILVKQHTLSKREAEYIQLIQKNTHTVGSFSDPLPSELMGNIKASSGKSVVGYISAYTTQEQRIFIDNSQLTDWVLEHGCSGIEVDNNPDSVRIILNNSLLPTTAIQLAGENIVRFYAVPNECVDCFYRGGVYVKPVFWED